MEHLNIKHIVIFVFVAFLSSCDAIHHLVNHMSMEPTHGNEIFKKDATIKEQQVPAGLENYIKDNK